MSESLAASTYVLYHCFRWAPPSTLQNLLNIYKNTSKLTLHLSREVIFLRIYIGGGWPPRVGAEEWMLIQWRGHQVVTNAEIKANRSSGLGASQGNVEQFWIIIMFHLTFTFWGWILFLGLLILRPCKNIRLFIKFRTNTEVKLNKWGYSVLALLAIKECNL